MQPIAWEGDALTARSTPDEIAERHSALAVASAAVREVADLRAVYTRAVKQLPHAIRLARGVPGLIQAREDWLRWLPGDVRSKAGDLLRSRRRLAQEWVGREVLSVRSDTLRHLVP